MAAAPLLHFFMVALLVAGVRQLATTAQQTSARLPAQIELPIVWAAALCRDEFARNGVFPSGREFAALLRRGADDEILLNAALARNLQRTDPVASARLAANLAFVGTSTSDPAKLMEQAIAMGMAKTDLVVRRRLIGRMKLEIEGQARSRTLSDDKLERYLQHHRRRYRVPPSYRFAQVFLSATRRSNDRFTSEVDRMQHLRSTDPPADPRHAAALGDPLLTGMRRASWSDRDIAKLLGPAMARAVAKAPVGRWTGPIRSPLGAHWVWLYEKKPGRLPELDEVRERVRYEVLTRRGRAALARAVGDLRRRTSVLLEGVPIDRLVRRLEHPTTARAPEANPAVAGVEDCAGLLRLESVAAGTTWPSKEGRS